MDDEISIFPKDTGALSLANPASQDASRTPCKWENSSAVNFRRSTMSWQQRSEWQETTLPLQSMSLVAKCQLQLCWDDSKGYGKKWIYVYFDRSRLWQSWFQFNLFWWKCIHQASGFTALKSLSLTVVWFDPRKVRMPFMKSPNVRGSPSSKSSLPQIRWDVRHHENVDTQKGLRNSDKHHD